MFHRSLFDEIKDNSFHIVKNQEEQIMKKKRSEEHTSELQSRYP